MLISSAEGLHISDSGNVKKFYYDLINSSSLSFIRPVTLKGTGSMSSRVRVSGNMREKMSFVLLFLLSIKMQS